MESSTRTYTLRERARKQAETRQRIVEATVALHREVGPARTTVAEIARRAGVQRLTVYNHFPEEQELFGACSAHFMSQHLPPDPAEWAALADPSERIRRALRDLHAWFASGEPMFANVQRDMGGMPALAEVVLTRRAEWDAALRSALGAGWTPRGARRARLMAAIGLACGFGAWQQLVRQEGLSAEDAVEVLAGAVEAAAG